MKNENESAGAYVRVVEKAIWPYARLEQVWAVWLDEQGVPVKRTCCWRGEASCGISYLRPLVAAALRLDARRVIVVHYLPAKSHEAEVAAQLAATTLHDMAPWLGCSLAGVVMVLPTSISWLGGTPMMAA